MFDVRVGDQHAQRRAGRRGGRRGLREVVHQLVRAAPLAAQLLEHVRVRVAVPRVAADRLVEAAPGLVEAQLPGPAEGDEPGPRRRVVGVELGGVVEAVLGDLQPPEEELERLFADRLGPAVAAGLPRPVDRVLRP